MQNRKTEIMYLKFGLHVTNFPKNIYSAQNMNELFYLHIDTIQRRTTMHFFLYFGQFFCLIRRHIYTITYGPGGPEHSAGNRIKGPSAISIFASPLRFNNVVTNGAQMTSFVMTLL